MATMSRRSFVLFAILFFLLFALLMVPAVWAQRERPLTTAGHLKAYSGEAPCGPVVHVDVTAPDKKYFIETDRDNQRDLQRLLKRVHRQLQNECPDLLHIVFIGKVDGREVYYGLASAEGNWEIAKIAAAAMPQVHSPVQSGNSAMPRSAASSRLISEYKDLQAFAPKNATCGPEYQVIIRAPNAADFSGDKDKVQKLLSNLRSTLKIECPQAKVIILIGNVARKEVYRGKAAEAENWALVDIVAPADTFKACRTADPKVVRDVLVCMGSAKFGSSDINIFENNIRTSDCESISRTYLNLFINHGYNQKEAKDRLPTCEIFAQSAKEMIGQPLSWASCTGYGEKGAKVHLEDCLSEFGPKYYGSKNHLNRIVGCEQVREEYEKALKSADPERRLPSGYIPPDCADANALVAKWTGRDPSSHPCAGFDANDIAGHISKCFGSPTTIPMNIRNCQDARRAYEQKLREAYGGLPPGYSMAGCTELKPLLAMAEDSREKLDAESAERERIRQEQKRRDKAVFNTKLKEMLEGKQPGEPAATSDKNITEKPEEIITDCDRLAAHPGDPGRPGKIACVTDNNLDIQSALEACMKAVDSSPEKVRYRFQLGRVLAVGGAYDEAVSLLQEASDSGYAAAKFYLADLFATGQGVGEDLQTAKRLNDEAVAGGFCPVDLSQFGLPEFLQAVYEGKTKSYAEQPLGPISYIINLNKSLGENTFNATDQAALLRVYDPTLSQMLERKILTNPVAQEQMMQGGFQAFGRLLRGLEAVNSTSNIGQGMAKMYGELYKGADGPGLTLAEIKELGLRDGKLIVYLFNDNPEVFMKLYNGIKRFVHEEL